MYDLWCGPFRGRGPPRHGRFSPKMHVKTKELGPVGEAFPAHLDPPMYLKKQV